MKMLCLFEKNSVGILLIRQDFFRAKDFKILMDFLKTKRIFAREVYKMFWGSMKCSCVSCFLGGNFQVFPSLSVGPTSSSNSWTL